MQLHVITSLCQNCEGNLDRSLGNYTPHSILLELTNLPAFTYHNSQSDGGNVVDPVVTKVYADENLYKQEFAAAFFVLILSKVWKIHAYMFLAIFALA
jgi:hypothetical protein